MLDNVRVEQLISQWEELLSQGQYIPPEELCMTCPELLDEVQKRIDEIEPRACEETAAPEIGGMATVIEPEGPRNSDAGALVIQQSYRKLKFHARGGLGEIYVADDSELQRDVVLKFIRPKHRDRRDCREQFQLEAEVTARLDHPGVVPVYGFGKTPDGRLCYAMRFIQGETLEEYIARMHSPTIEKDGQRVNQDSIFAKSRSVEFRSLLIQLCTVCNTIAYAHNRGILHRDIKPENIMLGKYDDTLVVDWGLAMPINRDEMARASGEQTLMPSTGSGGSSGGTTGGPVGTPAYMSPEQAAGVIGLGPATDIFSLGATLYKLLTGTAPYTGDSAREALTKARHGTYVNPSQKRDDIPRGLEAICLKAMAIDPDARYLTGVEIADDIELWLADQPVSALNERWYERQARWMRHHQGLAQTILTCVLLVVVGLTVWGTSAVNARNNLVQTRVEALNAEGRFHEHVIVSDFDELRNDIRLLVGRPALTDAALALEHGGLSEDLRLDTERLFLEFMAQNPNYIQVRYLANDAKGYEKMRMDRDNPGDEPVLIPETQLQPKGDREYFRDTVKLARNEVYLSGIDINREQGRYQWDRPVVRAGAPVYDPASSRVLGIVVINVHFGRIIESLEREELARAEQDELLVFLTDEEGRFLRFPGNRDVEFCFERDIEYPMESLFSELKNFRAMTDIETRELDVTPQVSILVSGTQSQTTGKSSLRGVLGDIMKDPQFRSLRVEESKYSEKDRTAKEGNDARPMAILVGDAATGANVLEMRLKEKLGPQFTTSILPGLDSSRSHAIYARKLFFDESKPERFLCLLLVMPYE
jgi:serine/threonine protein kinase